MDGGNGAELLERFMIILSDRDWHTIEDIADELSLSLDSLNEFLIELEDAEIVLVEGDKYKKTNLVKGTDFVDRFLELPVEEDFQGMDGK